jgi:hypothetical protein
MAHRGNLEVPGSIRPYRSGNDGVAGAHADQPATLPLHAYYRANVA